MDKHIAIIGSVGLPAVYGGFETLVEHLTSYLCHEYKLNVYCSSKAYAVKSSTHNNSKLIYIPLHANGAQSIPYDVISITHALFYADTLLVLGVSGCICLPVIRLFSRKKIVVNIDGLEWKRNKWNKFTKSFLKHSERLAVKYADTIISDNKVIQDYVLSEYGVHSMLIPYGADHVENLSLSREILHTYPFLKNEYAFSVCRIEPENNIHIILDALSKQTSVLLVLIGNWQASSYGIDLYSKYSIFQHIHLLDPIYDQSTLNQIRSNCLVYLHGHSAGGTNPSLVEAMYLGLPVFAFGVDYNKETTENKAQYFSNSNELVTLITSIRKNALSDMGQTMFKIAEKRYNWETVARQYAEAIN